MPTDDERCRIPTGPIPGTERMSDDRITVEVSAFEWKVVNYLRSLQEYGWGQLLVMYRNHSAVACDRTFRDGRRDLESQV